MGNKVLADVQRRVAANEESLSQTGPEIQKKIQSELMELMMVVDKNAEQIEAAKGDRKNMEDQIAQIEKKIFGEALSEVDLKLEAMKNEKDQENKRRLDEEVKLRRASVMADQANAARFG